MWILILVLTFGFAVSVFAYTELTPPNVERAIRGRKVHGLLAKKYVQETLIVGRTYALRTKEKGKFGRFLGEFKTGKGFITKLLIKERLAVPYTGQNKKEIAVAHEVNRIALIEEGKL